MRVLLVHNYYGSAAPSGENVAFEAEYELLKSYGHEVHAHTTHSDSLRSRGKIGWLQAAAITPWNPAALRQMKRLVRELDPDVVHFHNTFPLMSPSVLRACSGTRSAAVITLHNYRVACAAGTAMRDGRACTDCLNQHSVVPALRYGCYKDSRFATLPLAAMIALNRTIGTMEHVDAFITLTHFQRRLIVVAGLPADRIHVKPHFYFNPRQPIPWNIRHPCAVIIARLSPEKGIRDALDAWASWGAESPSLEIIGDGPERVELEARTRLLGLSGKVTFHGQLSFGQAQSILADSRLLLVPSRFLETFSMVLREAFALGVPVAASRIGALSELVVEGVNGEFYSAGDPADLLRVVRMLWLDQARLEREAGGARQCYEANLTAGGNHSHLMRIYAAAIEFHHSRGA
jgi:glycosyltransferase involved in cell wall biosynthesis